MKYDVTIVGAGIAGASAAYFLSKAGLKVLVVDVKPWERVGDKPCGDAIGKHHFDELGIPYPRSDELEGLVKSVMIYSPSEQHALNVVGEGFEVHRVRYVQRLLSEALASGADFMGGTHVRRPIVKNGYVLGVEVSSGGVREVLSDVVIDASGNARSVVRYLPTSWPITEQLDLHDANLAYREVRVLDSGVEEPEVLRIYISKRIAPGGYWWFFPYSLMDGYVNVGLGIQGSIRDAHPKDLLYRYVISRPEFRGSRVVEGGGALVPTRRPLPSLVWNGIAVIGDAAFAVNPIHGGGKGSSMTSAKCVSDAVVEALERGGNSASDLWQANICYIERYGCKQAALDVFRVFLQKLDDEDLEFGISRKLIREEDLNKISLKGEVEMGIADKALRVLTTLTRPTLLIKLRTVMKFMNIVKEHYRKYPQSPDNLPRWIAELEAILKSYYDALGLTSAA